MHAVAASIGVACFALLVTGGRVLSNIAPEWVGQLAWLALVLSASFVCGRARPAGAWRWGALIVCVQPICAYLFLRAVGELSKPTNSTGGMVAVLIFAGLSLFFVLPLAALASQLGARARIVGAHRQGLLP